MHRLSRRDMAFAVSARARVFMTTSVHTRVPLRLFASAKGMSHCVAGDGCENQTGALAIKKEVQRYSITHIHTYDWMK